jgi:hypothetical protein
LFFFLIYSVCNYCERFGGKQIYKTPELEYLSIFGVVCVIPSCLNPRTIFSKKADDSLYLIPEF